MTEIGPGYGYYTNDKKCWLIAKPDKEEIARETFKETAINITTQGKKHLEAVVGSRSYLTEYVDEKVEEWIKEVIRLSAFAITQPQARYAVYTLQKLLCNINTKLCINIASTVTHRFV